MTLSEFETKRYEKLVAKFVEKRRPPPHVRMELDLTFRIQGQSIEIYEVRRHWQDKTKMLEHPIAKATYNKSKRNWKVYWQRADLKWHSFEPSPEVNPSKTFSPSFRRISMVVSSANLPALSVSYVTDAIFGKSLRLGTKRRSTRLALGEPRE